MSVMKNIENQQLTAPPTLSMHPKKFALWLFIVTVVMVFAALTSAYMVRQGEGNWLVFDLPMLFYVSTGVILASSLTMQLAVRAAKKDEFGQLKFFMFLTFGLGVGFLVTQWLAWGALVDVGVFFAGSQSNPSGSFLYVISGLHGVHIISAVIFLLLVLVNVFRLDVHAKKLSQIEMCATYWHFLDALWLYLFFFLMYNN